MYFETYTYIFVYDNGIQEGSPQGRFATGRFATKLEGLPQMS